MPIQDSVLVDLLEVLFIPVSLLDLLLLQVVVLDPCVQGWSQLLGDAVALVEEEHPGKNISEGEETQKEVSEEGKEAERIGEEEIAEKKKKKVTDSLPFQEIRPELLMEVCTGEVHYMTSSTESRQELGGCLGALQVDDDLKI